MPPAASAGAGRRKQLFNHKHVSEELHLAPHGPKAWRSPVGILQAQVMGSDPHDGRPGQGPAPRPTGQPGTCPLKWLRASWGREANVRPPGAHFPHPDPNPAWGLAQYSAYIRHHFFCVAPISHGDRKRRPSVGTIMTSAPGVPEKPLGVLDITQHSAGPGPGEAAKAGVSTAPQE